MRANHRAPAVWLICAGLLIGAPAVAADDMNRPRGNDETRLMSGDLLGKRLFEDTRLSEPAGVSCASCHDPRTAFRGANGSPDPAFAAGSRKGVFGSRRTPSLLYASYSPPFGFVTKRNDVTGLPEIVPAGGQFWDGRAVDLKEQVEGPLLNPREMNNPSKRAVVDKVRKGPYAALARDVFGPDLFDDPNAFDKLASAIASYEATPRFKPFASKFDDWLEGKVLLTDEEWRGFQLFIDPRKGNCLSCHEGGGAEGDEGGPRDPRAPLSRNPKNWLFTDFTYDVLGAPRNPRIPDNADPAHADLGLCGRQDLANRAPRDFDIGSLCGAFKTPTLRNVAISGPYLHNGYFSNLRDVVAFYFTRDTNPERWYPRNADGGVEKYDDLPPSHRGAVNDRQAPYDRKPGEAPRADDAEIDAIVAFLGTLTDRPAPPAR